MLKKLFKNKLSMFIIILSVFCFAPNVQADSEELFTFELGTVTATRIRNMPCDGFNPLEVAQIGYMRKRGNAFLHTFIGSLDEGDVQEERTSYGFVELGYRNKLIKEPYHWAVSFGIGRVDQTGDRYFTSNNMFTESISIGYKNYYLSLRHMSNGYEPLGNPGPNMGRNTITLGFKF